MVLFFKEVDRIHQIEYLSTNTIILFSFIILPFIIYKVCANSKKQQNRVIVTKVNNFASRKKCNSLPSSSAELSNDKCSTPDFPDINCAQERNSKMQQKRVTVTKVKDVAARKQYKALLSSPAELSYDKCLAPEFPNINWAQEKNCRTPYLPNIGSQNEKSESPMFSKLLNWKNA